MCSKCKNDVQQESYRGNGKNDPKDYPEHLHGTSGATNKTGGNTRSTTKRRAQKAPGNDGIGVEFYTTTWKIIKKDIADILNQMFLQRSITPQKNHGTITCLPKSNTVQNPEGYRPIMLLKSDCKMLARVLANRLRQVMEEHLRTSQFCSVPGIAIIEAASIVREAVTHAEVTDTPLCVISLDFRKAFDRNAMTIASQYWRVMV
jgi:hypothetical protein